MKFQTLYAIVNDEIDNQTTNARNSATDALLWLKRSLFILFYRKNVVMSQIIFVFRAFEFLSNLLNEIGQGDKALVDATIKAYEQSLKRHHGLLARHVFSVSRREISWQFDG